MSIADDAATYQTPPVSTIATDAAAPDVTQNPGFNTAVMPAVAPPTAITGIAADAATYSPNDPNVTHQPGFNNTVLPGSKDLPVDNRKLPDFMTKLSALGSATAEAGLSFTSALFNQPKKIMDDATKGTFLDTSTKGDSLATSAQKSWAEKNKQYAKDYSGLENYQTAGKLIPEMAAYALVDKGAGLLGKGLEAAGGLMKAAKIPYTSLGVPGVNFTGRALETIGQGPKAVGAAFPPFTKLAAEYGAGGVKNAAEIAAVEGLRNDTKNPNQVFNTDQALDVVKNPALAIGAGVLGHGVGNYLDSVRTLGKGIDEYSPYAMNVMMKEPSYSRTLQMKMAGAFPNLFGFGKLIDLLDNTSTDTRNFVGKLLGNTGVKNSIESEAQAGKSVQAALTRVKKVADDAWEQVPTEQNVSNPQTVIDSVDKVRQIFVDSDIPAAKKILHYIDRNLPEKATPSSSILDAQGIPMVTATKPASMTIAEAKNIQSLIGGASQAASRIKNGGDAARQMAAELRTEKENILNHISDSLSETDQVAFAHARALSLHNFELNSIAPSIPKAVKNGVIAMDVANKMASEAGWNKMRPIFDDMSQVEQNAVAQHKILKALDNATEPGGRVRIGEFAKATGDLSRTGATMGDTHQAYEDFLKYLQGVEQEGGTGWWTQATVGGTVAAGAASGGLISKAVGATIGASLGALSFVANHSPLKRALHAATRKIPDSTHKALSKYIDKIVSGAGYFLSKGTFQHKDEEINNEGAQ